MLDFCPPKDSPLVINFVNVVLPMMMAVGETTVEVVGDGIERFKQLEKQRTVICPNHPNHHDPAVMFSFSRLVGESFNFLAAREVFDWHHGCNGWLLQHLGCYSVVRGAPDRESFKTTKRLLLEGKKKLVIFPEGEISQQNDTLMTLESGVAQMSYWALEELQKTSPDLPIYLLPIALKYTFTRNIRSELETSLWKLEEKLGIHTDHQLTLYQRLRLVADTILKSLEREYGAKPPELASMNERIALLKGVMLKSVATFLNVDLPDNDNVLEWIRILRNHLDDFVYADESIGSAYEKRLHEQKSAQYRGFYRDLDRVVNFIAIYDGYLRESMSQERFADVLNRFETEVFGRCSPKGPRRVFLHVGEPINLLDRYAEYKANKRNTLRSVNENMTEQISFALKSMDRDRSVIIVD